VQAGRHRDGLAGQGRAVEAAIPDSGAEHLQLPDLRPHCRQPGHRYCIRGAAGGPARRIRGAGRAGGQARHLRKAYGPLRPKTAAA
jgi:hypothetical protein